MPSLLAQVSTSPMIQQYAQGFAQQMTAPVADFLAPTVEVATMVGRFKVYNERERFMIAKAERAIGGRAAQVGFAASDASYNCTPRALDFPMDYLEIEEEAAAENLFMEAAQILGEQATLNHEQVVVTNAVNALTPTATALQFSSSSVDPVAQIDSVILAVIKAARYGSLMGVGVLFGATAWNLFKNNPNVRGRFIVGDAVGNGTVGTTVTNEAGASKLFIGEPQVMTSYMVYDQGSAGGATSISFILDSAVIIFARVQNPTRRDPSFMKTFRKMGQWMVPGSYVREDGRGETAKMDWSEDIQITNAAAGQMINVS